MNICITCLKTPADKHIAELEKGVKESNKKYFEIMMFCLDIEVTEDSKVTTNLCSNCYRKIISFYKFKTISLKNNLYLKSLSPVERCEEEKQSVYLGEEGIKHENFLDSEEFGPSLVADCDTEFKIEKEVKLDKSYEALEIDVKKENILSDLDDVEDEEQPNIKQEVKNKNIAEDSKENAPVHVKRGRTKKEKTLKKPKWKPERQMCDECGKSFLNLKEHSLKHKPKEERLKLQCKACPKTFFTIGGRKKHYRVTHMGLKFKCEICSKEVADVKLHIMVMHNPAALPYGCVQCERRFKAQSALDGHMITHTKDLPFECDVCQKRFGSKNSVLRHIREVHEKIRGHQCTYCPKAFFKFDRLQAHVRSHTNERPYKCEECGKAFSTAPYLKDHLRTHGTKSFQCQQCDMSFAKRGNLRAHMISHTKEKRYPCGFCGVRFGRSDHRNRHQLTAHQKLKVAD